MSLTYNTGLDLSTLPKQSHQQQSQQSQLRYGGVPATSPSAPRFAAPDPAVSDEEDEDPGHLPLDRVGPETSSPSSKEESSPPQRRYAPSSLPAAAASSSSLSSPAAAAAAASSSAAASVSSSSVAGGGLAAVRASKKETPKKGAEQQQQQRVSLYAAGGRAQANDDERSSGREQDGGGGGGEGPGAGGTYYLAGAANGGGGGSSYLGAGGLSSSSSSSSLSLSSSTAVLLPFGPSRGVVGLQNLGNTCFMNSALQCFFNTPPLLHYFSEQPYRDHLNAKSQMGGELAKTFADTFLQVLKCKEHGCVNPATLKRVVGRWAPHLSGYQQQDAQEFMRFLMDGLSEDLNNKSPRPSKPHDLTEEQLGRLAVESQSDYWWRRHLALNDSIVTETFCGQFMSKLVCCTCKDVSYTFEPFFDLSVPIPSSGGGASSASSSSSSRTPRSSGDKGMFAKITDFSSSLGRSKSGIKKDSTSASGGGGATASAGQPGGLSDVCTIEDCLSAFTAEEVMDNENKMMCSKCKQKRKGTKRITIHRFPRILVLHIKRFQFDAVKRSKLSTNVLYPLQGLDMSPFMSSANPAAADASSSSSSSSSASPQSVVLGVASASAARYDLFALTNHMGGLHGGHYTAHCKNVNTGEWHCFNDSHVSRVDPSEFTAEAGLPYVLFYRRVDGNYH